MDSWTEPVEDVARRQLIGHKRKSLDEVATSAGTSEADQPTVVALTARNGSGNFSSKTSNRRGKSSGNIEFHLLLRGWSLPTSHIKDFYRYLNSVLLWLGTDPEAVTLAEIVWSISGRVSHVW